MTAADTGVGKTFVGCALAAGLRKRGVRVLACKLLETGCSEVTQPTEDGVLLAEASGQREPRRALERFACPVTPALAAEMEHREIHLEDLLKRLDALAEGFEVVLLEGAGGLLAPITWQKTMLDVVQRLDAECIVVAADRLGTLHHARAMLWLLETQHRRPSAVVFNQGVRMEGDASFGHNAQVLERVSGYRSLVLQGALDPAVDELAERVLASVRPGSSAAEP